jgi:RNA polymerase sigma factor (sigma-70 family)
MLENRYLVWRLKRGSAQALCRIYNRYESDLLTLATSLLGRTSQAEDVLQDVFVKFIESIDTFELTGSLKGYLAKCVANRARDYLRRDRGRRAEDGRQPSGDRCPSRRLAPSPVEAVIVDEQRQRLVVRVTAMEFGVPPSGGSGPRKRGTPNRRNESVGCVPRTIFM